MLRDGERDTFADALDRALKRGVRERHDRAAAVADEMVVVLARLGDALVADHGLSRLDALDETEALELVEHAIDAGAADGAPLAAEQLLDFERAERAALAAKQLEQRPASAAAPAAGPRERPLRVVGPRGSLLLNGAHG